MGKLVIKKRDPLAELVKEAQATQLGMTKMPRWWQTKRVAALCKSDCPGKHVASRLTKMAFGAQVLAWVLTNIFFLVLIPVMWPPPPPAIIVALWLLILFGGFLAGSIVLTNLSLDWMKSYATLKFHKKTSDFDPKSLIAAYLADELKTIKARLIGPESKLAALRSR